MAPAENAFSGKWAINDGETPSIGGPKSLTERDADTGTKTTRGGARHTGAEITSTCRESLASAAGEVINLRKRRMASQNMPTFSERRSSLEGEAFAVRNTEGNKVMFRENLVSTNDSTALPRKHNQPRWVEHPKWVMCRECNKWRRVVPSKTQKPPSRSHCSCDKRVLDAGTVHFSVAQEDVIGERRVEKTPYERSAKKRLYDERGEGNQIPYERDSHLVRKKVRRLRLQPSAAKAQGYEVDACKRPLFAGTQISWVQCAHCKKLRALKAGMDPCSVIGDGKQFFCVMNWWHLRLSSCMAPEERCGPCDRVVYSD